MQENFAVRSILVNADGVLHDADRPIAGAADTGRTTANVIASMHFLLSSSFAMD